MRLKRKRKLNKIVKNGKTLILAYDQGLEHGPTDFNDKNVDPNYIIKIAKENNYSALAFQKGIAEKYNKEIKESKIPLIIKLNGKTSLVKGDPLSRQLCTVKEAKRLGAIGVGYTIYIGSFHEPKMLQEFENIQRQAHKRGLPVILWIYPRGHSIKNKPKNELMAYATRTALEIGADIVKIKWEQGTTFKDLAWAVKVAGKTKVVIAGGVKKNEQEFLTQVKQLMKAGCAGLAIGRNVWQSKNPDKISKQLKKIVLK
jgi:fructose-bisphosphate aldolase, class I